MDTFNWKLTKCRAKFSGKKSSNYTFYIVDYTYKKFPTNTHITELRNNGLVNTKYFINSIYAKRFINTEGGRLTIDDFYEKSAKKFMPKLIDNIFRGDK